MKAALALRKIPFQSQRQVSVCYKGVQIVSDLRADFVVADKVVLELKAVDAILPVHRAQIPTYMRLTGCEAGLLTNFNVELPTKGIERFVL